LAKDSTRQERLASVLYNALDSLRIIAVLIYPVIPRTAVEIWRQIGQEDQLAEQEFSEATSWGRYRPDSSIQRGEALFPRVEAPPA
jgi:methionyl-tRNA synthetase